MAFMATNYGHWRINLSTGAASSGPSENTYQGEASTKANGAMTVTCTGCSGGQSVGWLGGSPSGTATFTVSSSATTTTTIRIMAPVCLVPILASSRR